MPALKRNRCNFLFVSITDLGNRLQQQKAEFFWGGAGGRLSKSLSKSLSKRSSFN